MRKLKKILSLVLAITMVFGLISNPMPVQAAETDAYVAELLGYYKTYQESAATDIERVLSELKSVDEATGEAWENIMNYWSAVNAEGFVNVDTVPEGLPEDDSMAVVILGFALNADGTMKEELIGRLQAGLNVANAYENCYVVVTGGGTAANNPNVTEGGLMGEWLLEQGLDEDRLIIENRAGSTVGNAEMTYDILKTEYPMVDSVVLVTSDYHVPRGCIIYYSKFVLDALAKGQEPLTIISNAGNSTGSNGYESISLQTSGVQSVSGVTAASGLELSELLTITVTQEGPYAAGEELALTFKGTYDVPGEEAVYERDLTDLVEVTGFDPALGADQTVSISYTENDVTITGRFALSETEKTLNAYAAQLEKLVTAAAETPSIYTEKSLETLQFAVENAEAVLADAASTDEDIFAAKEVLNKAVEALIERENIALKKPATASANTANAYKLTDGNLGSYWETLENGNNIPINESHFVIDLQGIYDVDTIKAVPYFKGEERYYHYDISVSTDNVTWEKVAEQRSTEDTLESGAVFTLEEAKEARYIRVDGVAVSVTGRDDINNFHVTEMMVYGDLVEEVEIEKAAKEATNLAVYSKVTANEGGTSIDLLTDSKIENAYSNSNKGIADSYVVVELPGKALLESFRVVTYYNNTAKWYTWEVLVSDDNATWTSVGKYETESNPGKTGATITLEEPVTGKYVKFQGLNTNNTNLHLVEVEAYGTIDNIAEGKPTTVNKYSNNNGAAAVDGNKSSYWDSDTTWAEATEADYPSLIVDLEAVYELDRINVLNYRSTSRYYQYEIYTSVDGEEYTLFAEKKDEANSTFNRTFVADETTARYIKFVGTKNSANSGFHLNELTVTGTLVPEEAADYSAVEAALAKVPADFSVYTAASVVDLKIAVAGVEEGLMESQQKRVDAMAAAIEDAVAALIYKAADYTAVEEALATVPADLSVYTDETATAVTEAVNAVVRDKNITEQSEVDAMAKAIEDAVAALAYKAADYTAVDAALAKVPADLTVYTDETANAVEEAVNAVVRDKNITEQSEVDAMAKAIEDAVSALTYKAADYSAVEEALAKVPSDLSVYTDETANALEEAVNAVVRDKNITEQSEVDAMAKAIEDAVTALAYKAADYSAVEEALAKVPTDLSVYTEETANAVTAAVNAVVRDKNITEQSEVDAMAKAIEDAVAALELLPTPEPTPAGVDKTQLLAAIAEAEALNADDYTAESWNEMQSLLTMAKVLAKSDVSQFEVDYVADALNEAIAGLVPAEKPVEPTPTETEAPVPTETEVPLPTETETPQPTETEAPLPESTIIGAQLLDGTKLTVVENGTEDFQWGGTYPVLEVTVPKGTEYVQLILPENVTVYDDAAFAKRNPEKIAVDPATVGGDFEFYLLFINNGTPYYFVKFVEAELPIPTETEAPQPTATEAPTPTETQAPTPTATPEVPTETVYVEIDGAILAANAMANSEQNPAKENDGPAAWAFDENDNWWHSRWGGEPASHEVPSGKPEDNAIWIQTGFGEALTIGQLTYVARPTRQGVIKDYTISVANLEDSTAVPTDDDFTVIKTDVMACTTDAQTITFDAVEATHIRITVTSVYSGYDADGTDLGNGFIQAKTIKVYEAKEVPVTPTETEAPVPTETEAPVPTETEAPVPTETEAPVPTETEAPVPTETEAPQPTETEAPQPTETPVVKEDVTTVFDDVFEDWYTDYVQYVYDNGLMTGIKGTKHFAPNANITKAQVAQVLYNMEKQPGATVDDVFSDLNDVYEAEWYADAVAWAYATGVVTGDLNTKKFSPNADVTREQLALMMFRYAKYKGYDVTATSDYEGIVNADKVNNWAAEGMSWAVGAGLISGIEKDGVKDLAPQGNASRAQVAAILQRFCENVK